MHHVWFLKPMLLLSAVSLLMDLYVYQGLKTLSASWTSVRRRRLFLRLYCWLFIGVTVAFIAGISISSNGRLTRLQEWLLSLFVTFLITKLFFILVLFIGDIVRFLSGVLRALTKPKGQPKTTFLPSRRRFVAELAVLVAAIPFTGFFYAMLQGKYDYRIHRSTLYFDDLPVAFDGFTITQLSDFHSGSFDNTAAVQRGIDMAKAQGSDLFVFTGDLVNNIAWEVEPYLPIFSQLKAPYGQFSILGNHDYGDYMEWDHPADKVANLEKLKAHHKELGYRLLLDEHVQIEKDGQQISLIGVQNWGRGFIQKGDIDKALEGVDPAAFKILLSHDPTHWEEKIRYHPTKVDLTLSGHTHGAQFGIETDKFRWSPVEHRYLDWAGLANEKDRWLYVNRGFGFLAFSGRLGIWPEITVITLKKKQA